MNLGVVGTGTIVKEVLPHLREWGYEPVALCGTPRSRDVVAQLATLYQVDEEYTDYEAFLESKNVEVVYVAVPNHLHYEMAKRALVAGKHVILEKPFTVENKQAQELEELAKSKQLFLFEAISTLYLKNYIKIKEMMGRIGSVKVVSCNFSQYSRRYEAFQRGEILPVFDATKAGGALMDLNVYNIFWLYGLFGAPKAVGYQANIEKGVDTSGVLTLDYGDYKAVSIAAKDCGAPCRYVIQGTKGYILQENPANACLKMELHLNDGTIECFEENPSHRLEPEFLYFREAIEKRNYEARDCALEASLSVVQILSEARKKAGLC